MSERTIHLELAVERVPADVSDAFVASQVNVTLGERYWGRWTVGKATVTTPDDADALDRVQHMLRDPQWGVGMLEDIADIVRGTGRDVENLPGDAPTWGRH